MEDSSRDAAFRFLSRSSSPSGDPIMNSTGPRMTTIVCPCDVTSQSRSG